MSFPFIFELFIVLLHRALSSLHPPRFPARARGCLGKAGDTLLSCQVWVQRLSVACHGLVFGYARWGRCFYLPVWLNTATTCPGMSMARSDSPLLPSSEAPPTHPSSVSLIHHYFHFPMHSPHPQNTVL